MGLLRFIWVVGVSLGLAYQAFADTNKQRFTFLVNAPGAAPYVYYSHSEGAYVGLLPDFLNTLKEQGLLSVEYLDSNRTRNEAFIYEGKADAFLSSLSWLSHPEQVIASDTVIEHRTYLYSLTPFAPDFTLANAKYQRICTRRGYVYPALMPLFDRKQDARIDSANQKNMLDMLVKQRCDYVILNEYNALRLFNSSHFCHQTFYQSPQPVDIVAASIILSKKNQALLPMINEHLQLFKQSGRFAASLEKHTQPLIQQCQN